MKFWNLIVYLAVSKSIYIPYLNVSDHAIRLLNYRWFKSLTPPLLHMWVLWRYQNWVDHSMQKSYHATMQIIVKRCLLKLLYKHNATCALLAIQKSVLDYDRKVAKRQSGHECCHSNDTLSQDLCRMPVYVLLPAFVYF